MHRLTWMFLFALATPAGAQVVERPEAFDSAGRIESLTPDAAAEAHLLPPAWHITGDYTSARLYATSDSTWVIVVTRPSGTVERYPITSADREYLRMRTSSLPRKYEEPYVNVSAATQSIGRATQNSFIRNQSILGLGVYAPAFAYTVTNDNAGRAASWLLVSGLTFFGASEVARDYPISDTQNTLATSAALHVAAAGLAIGYSTRSPDQARAAMTFFGGIGGTLAGLYYGRGMNDDEAYASGWGSDMSALLALGVTQAKGSAARNEVSRGDAGVIAVAGLIGYPIGYMYSHSASYRVTAGDVNAMWATGAIGALLGSEFTVGRNVNDNAKWASATGGFAAGLVAGDLFLTRRYDHTRSEGAVATLGAVAGGLMGAGVYVLVDRNSTHDALGLALAAVGAAAGLAETEHLLGTRADAGHLASLQFHPEGIAAAAMRAPGAHSILSITF